jgi:hypothetical protein
MKRLFFVLFLCLTAIVLVFSSCKSKRIELPVVLENATEQISQVIRQMDTSMSAISKKLATVAIDSEKARNILRNEFGKINSVIEIVTITPEGVLCVIVPDTYKGSEGSDISKQEHIIKVKQTKKPVLSSAFAAVEGFQAIVLAYPVISASKELSGITAMVIRPESFLKNIITPVIEGVPVDIWVMQKDGVILYDYDTEEIGRNLFTDPLYQPYTESLKTAARIAEEKDGSATYNFLGRGLEKPVTNEAFWATIDTYGNEWKIVLIKPIGEHDVKRTIKDLGLKTAADDLKALAGNEDFLSLVARGNKEEALIYFQSFYAAHKVYAIEYTDSTVTCQFGYPPSHSLENYPIKSEDLREKSFYDAVVNRTEATFKETLIEGNTGTFYCCPMTYQGKYLGVIYYIIIDA